MADQSRSVTVLRRDGDRTAHESDGVAVEDPLEIRLGETPLAVTMRTPGDDSDLVLGFLLTEGILIDPNELHEIERFDDSKVAAHFKPGIDVDPARFQRNMFISSSCGVCGKASIEAVRIVAPPASDFGIAAPVVATLTARLRELQPTFDETGGLHAAGVFDLEGTPRAVREDVGRHNAVDKAIGAVAQLEWPLSPSVLVVSGRQSFEIVQKAAVVRIGGVVGISAPSSLAIELADSLNMLLVGFSRGDTFNVYAGAAHLTD